MPNTHPYKTADVSRETKKQLLRYQDLLLKWQKKINLISPNTIKNSWERHFLDSLQWVPLLPEDTKTLADLGTGAGFPGLVWAVARPDVQVHLVESDTRKCSFLRRVKTELGLENVTIHNQRIEDVIMDPVDIIAARALAPLSQLMIWSQNLAHSKSRYFFQKGRSFQEEVSALESMHSDIMSEWMIKPYPSQIEEESVLLIMQKK